MGAGLGGSGPSLALSPRTGLSSNSFDVLMQFSDSLQGHSDVSTICNALLDAASKFLESSDPYRATQFAREAIVLDAEGSFLDRAATIIFQAESMLLKLPAISSTTYYKQEIAPLCAFMEENRERLSEDISEKDADLFQRAAAFSNDVFNRVLIPLANNVLTRMSKPPTKFALVSFGLACTLEDRLPYDGLNLGVILQDFSESNAAYFRDFLRVLSLKIAQLGESPPVIFARDWNARFPGLRVTTVEEFLGLELIGGVEQFLKFFEVTYEDSHIAQSFMLLHPQFIVGDKTLLKRYQKEMQTLMESFLLVPLTNTGDVTYKEFAVAKLPVKKKLDLFEAPVQIRNIKAAKFLGWIGNRWCGDLFLEKDHPFPRMVTLREEFWVPVYGTLLALRVLNGIPVDTTMDAALEQLQQQQILGKRSTRHIKSALTKIAKYRMLAQLKTHSSNEYLYHGNISSKPPGAWEISGKYLEKVMDIYQTVLPLVIGADDFYSSRVLTKNTFNLENLKLDTPWVRVLGFQRLGMDEDALADCLKLAEGQSHLQRLLSVTENTSNTRVAMGDISGALVDLGLLKEVCADNGSKKHVATVNSKLSVVLDLAGQDERAERVRNSALKFMAATHSAKRDRLCLMINQACLLMKAGNPKDAIPLLETVIKNSGSHRTKKLQKRALQLALPTTLHNLGTCYMMLDEPDKAVAVFDQALRLVSQRYGIDSLEAGFCFFNLAAAHLAASNLAAAKSAVLEGASSFCRVFGRSDEHVVATLEFCKDIATRKK